MLIKLRNAITKRIFRNMDFYEIEINELNEKQKNGAQIVDVRSEQEYREGHINGAINIPEYKINKCAKKVLNDVDKEIVVYCQSGYRGKDAYKKLKKLGYKNVFNLYGGLDNI